MASEQIRRDLSSVMQNRLAETYDRQLQIAAVVLSKQQIGELMFEAAMMVLRSSAASIAALAENEKDMESIYEAVIAALFASEKAGRAEALARAVARRGAPI